MELPMEFLEQMKNMLGEAYPDYLESFSHPAHSALRVNTGKISVEEFRQKTGWNLRPVPWVSNGFYYEDAANPAKHPHYYAGLYYLQGAKRHDARQPSSGEGRRPDPGSLRGAGRKGDGTGGTSERNGDAGGK